MASVTNSLLWKHWRESRALVAAFSVWMILAVCYNIGYELGHGYRAVVGGFSGSALMYALVAAIILAIRTARGEHSDGSILFSAAIPSSMRRLAMARLLAAVATLALPIVVAGGLLWIALAAGIVEQASPRTAADYVRLPERGTASLWTTTQHLGCVMAISVVAGTQLLLVLALFGCWLRTSSQIGLLGVVLALATMIAADVVWSWGRSPVGHLIAGALLPQTLVIHWGYGDEIGSYTDHQIAPYPWLGLGSSLIGLAIIGRIFVSSYGRIRCTSTAPRRPRLALAAPPLFSRLPIRWPNRWAAILWFELRRSVPLAVLGLLLAVLIAVAVVLTNQPSANGVGTLVRMELPHTTFFVAMLWAAVVGSSLYAAELDSRLGNFWRSRPISLGMWFWPKYIIGLVVVIAVLDGVTILVSWNAPRSGPTEGMSWSYVACFPIIHAVMFTLAVLGTCWIRRPVIGAVASVLAYTLLTAAITAFPATNRYEPVNLYNYLLEAERLGHLDLTHHGYPWVYGALAASILPLAIMAFRLAKPLQGRSPRLTLAGA